jgi:hypothetical protein
VVVSDHESASPLTGPVSSSVAPRPSLRPTSRYADKSGGTSVTSRAGITSWSIDRRTELRAAANPGCQPPPAEGRHRRDGGHTADPSGETGDDDDTDRHDGHRRSLGGRPRRNLGPSGANLTGASFFLPELAAVPATAANARTAPGPRDERSRGVGCAWVADLAAIRRNLPSKSRKYAGNLRSPTPGRSSTRSSAPSPTRRWSRSFAPRNPPPPPAAARPSDRPARPA